MSSRSSAPRALPWWAKTSSGVRVAMTLPSVEGCACCGGPPPSPVSVATRPMSTTRPLDQRASLDCSQIDGARMAWLVHPDLATAGQAKAGDPPPPLLGDVLGELDALGA